MLYTTNTEYINIITLVHGPYQNLYKDIRCIWKSNGLLMTPYHPRHGKCSAKAKHMVKINDIEQGHCSNMKLFGNSVYRIEACN